MTSFEFENELRLALRQAAQREMQRSRLARSIATTRSALVVTRRSLVPATAVLATMIALGLAAVLLTFGHSRPEPVRPPEIIARLALGDSLGTAVGAYGSVWIDDRGGNRLLRVDPANHRVTARIPVSDDVFMAPARGSVWALVATPAPASSFPTSSLIRIAPRTAEVTARMSFRTPAGDPFWGLALAADDQSIWILGTTKAWHNSGRLGVLRIDPRTGRATTLIPLPGTWDSDGIALRDGVLSAITFDPQQRVLRYDALTGTKILDRQIALPDPQGDPSPGTFGFVGNTLVATIRGGLAGIDPSTGRVLWRRPLGQGVSAWTEAGGRIWAVVQTGATDRVVAVEPRHGRLVTGANLAEVGTAGIATAGHELWITTGGGKAVILER
jgi:hypothetical protein